MQNANKSQRIRASFNKFNLYNLLTWRKTIRRGTLYQQKWSAKAETRSYHGEKLTETQFRNIFDGKLNAVAPLKSQTDGQTAPVTPFAMQAYAGVEKRLDQSVFRAMFAASPRQAAQFIRYGKVKVNGVTMKHAGYKLSPGDIFSVDPDRVLQALGRSKPSLKQSVTVTNGMISRYNRYIRKCKKHPKYMWRARLRFKKRHPVHFMRYQKNRAKRIAQTNDKIIKKINEDINAITPSTLLKSILLDEPYFDKFGTLPQVYGSEIQSKSLSVLQLITGKRAHLSKDKPEEETKSEAASIEEASKPAETESVEPSTSSSSPSETTTQKSATTTPASSESVPPADEAKVDSIVNKYFPPRRADGTNVPADERPKKYSDIKKLLGEITRIREVQIKTEGDKQLIDPSEINKNEPYDPEWVKRLGPELELINYEAVEEDPASVLPIRLPWQAGGHFGLQDMEKPYFSPWAPRPFLSPFAILPHHLEVSFETCHAVYLRDPVSRPGHSEVISPFPLDMHERAYMFYATRRRKA